MASEDGASGIHHDGNEVLAMARTVAEFCRTLVCDINALPVDLVAQEVERQVRRFMTEHLEDEHHCTVGDCRGCR